MKKLLLFFLILFLIPLSLAHLDGGEDIVVGNYVVDFGYTPLNPQTHESVAMVISLGDSTGESPSDATDVWVRVSSEDEILFAGTLQIEQGVADFSMTFLEPGEYEVKTRFMEDGEDLAETTFHLTVEEKPRIDPVLLGIVIGLLLLVLLVLMIKKRK